MLIDAHAGQLLTLVTVKGQPAAKLRAEPTMTAAWRRLGLLLFLSEAAEAAGVSVGQHGVSETSACESCRPYEHHFVVLVDDLGLNLRRTGTIILP